MMVWKGRQGEENAGGVAQVVELLPSKHRTLSFAFQQEVSTPIYGNQADPKQLTGKSS
jgi:hypothetical protein